MTDSAWFWGAIYGSVAIVALVVIAPKHAQRQARLERMANTRERIAFGDAAQPVESPDERSAPPPPGAEGIIAAPQAAGEGEPPPAGRQQGFQPWRAAMIALAIALAVAATGVGIVNYLRIATRRAQRGGVKESRV